MVAKVRWVSVTDGEVGQRLDNFLIKSLKGVPKSRIYRAISKGEVRVNKGRSSPGYRLCLDDQVRIPPIVTAARRDVVMPKPALQQSLENRIVLENESVILISKPSGMPVHGGSGTQAGLIELLRLMRPEQHFLELVHRLDKGTSGCLLIAKKRAVLRHLHEALRQRRVNKQYLALVRGAWQGGSIRVEAPLLKNVLSSGERVVRVSQDGKPSVTIFKPIQVYQDATLVHVRLLTGRTHQIRVHAAHINHPLAGDDKYGDQAFNMKNKRLGLSRLFLHACELSFSLEEGGENIQICAPLDRYLLDFLASLD